MCFYNLLCIIMSYILRSPVLALLGHSFTEKVTDRDR